MAKRFLTGLRLLNLTSDPATGSEGELYFNTTSYQVRMYADGDWKYASESSEEVQLQVKNNTGSTINKGTPVRITGTTGADNILTIAPASATSASTMPAVGLLASNLNNDEEGFAVISGFLRGLNTATIDGQTPIANQTVYVKANGGLTLTKPTGTALIQNIAKVGRVDSTTGSLIVSSIMRTNDIPNIPQNKFWLGNASAVPTAVDFTTEVNRSASATYLTIASASATYQPLGSGGIGHYFSTASPTAVATQGDIFYRLNSASTQVQEIWTYYQNSWKKYEDDIFLFWGDFDNNTYKYYLANNFNWYLGNEALV